MSTGFTLCCCNQILNRRLMQFFYLILLYITNFELHIAFELLSDCCSASEGALAAQSLTCNEVLQSVSAKINKYDNKSTCDSLRVIFHTYREFGGNKYRMRVFEVYIHLHTHLFYIHFSLWNKKETPTGPNRKCILEKFKSTISMCLYFYILSYKPRKRLLIVTNIHVLLEVYH